MNRPRFQSLQLVVIFRPVELQSINTAGAFLGVEPAARDDRSNSVNAVLNPVHLGDREVLQPKAFQNFQARLTRSKLLGLRVMWHDMTRV
jgi:hypothetical protein